MMVQVLLKFLSRVNVKVDTVLDGVQCTEKVFSNPHGYYSIILVSVLKLLLMNKINTSIVRSSHAQQGRLPDVSRDSQVGEEDQATILTNCGTFGQRHGRCVCKMRRRWIQQLCHQTSRLQGTQHRHVDFPGPFGPQTTDRIHEAEEVSIGGKERAG